MQHSLLCSQSVGIERIKEKEINMVNNQPKPKRLFESGKELLNLSWERTIDMFLSLNQAEELNGKIPKSRKNSFWKHARRELLTAYTLVLQGAELLIKGKIAEVSPLLLIDKLSERVSHKKTEYDFGEFCTIEESKLIEVCNCLTNFNIDSTFKDWFPEKIKKRNKIIHLEILEYKTPDEIEKLALDILKDILFINKVLFPDEYWLAIRENFLKNSIWSDLYDDPDVKTRVQLCKEYDILEKKFQPAEMKKFFDIDAKSRAYYCPNCIEDCGEHEINGMTFARMLTKGANATILRCPVCNQTIDVDRYPCANKGCKGSVHFYGQCLTCLDRN